MLVRPLISPEVNIVPVGRTCRSLKELNVESLRRRMITGKRIEHMNEVLMAQKYANMSTVYMKNRSTIHMFLSCPYYDSMRITSDPWREARTAVSSQSNHVARLFSRRQICAYAATHTLSFPDMFSKLRYCTAMVEDKTYSGNDKDLIIPAGAIKYHRRNRPKRCSLLFFGNPSHGQGRYDGLRQNILTAMRNTGREDFCYAINVNTSTYIDLISEAQFCITPPGDTQGGEKLAIAIMNGCIPVIEYHDWRYQPFFTYLNYSKFAIRGFHDITRLQQQLAQVSYDDMYRNLVEAQNWFDYTRMNDKVSPYSLILSSIQELWQ